MRNSRTLEIAVGALAAMGVTRASLGVQDFDKAVQEAIGRHQTYDETARAAEHGNPNIRVGVIGFQHIADALPQVLAGSVSRIPLFDRHRDNIHKIVYLRDLLEAVAGTDYDAIANQLATVTAGTTSTTVTVEVATGVPVSSPPLATPPLSTIWVNVTTRLAAVGSWLLLM